MKKMLLIIALFLSIGIQQSAMAQSSTTVTGRILDDQGEGIPSASIQIKGTYSGANTDVDGNFSLEVPDGKDILIIKSHGFNTQEVSISKVGTSITVRLQLSKADIGEIQVYGQKIDERTNIGSVQTITAKDIEKKPITNIIKALDGAAGIQLTSGGGQPGSEPQMLVRGFGSLSANSAPLIVMDGVIYNGGLSSINPSDVESISLLKDATASSLYGARGANGVILVTTKKGRQGAKPQINIDAQTGIVNNMMPLMETLNQEQFYTMVNRLTQTDLDKINNLTDEQLINDFWKNVGGQGYNNYDVAPDKLFTNWRKAEFNKDAKLLYDEPWLAELQRTGIRHVYNVSVANANDNSNYYFSLGYNNDEGIVKYTSYERITTKLSVDANVTSWMKAGLSFYGTFEDQRRFGGSNNSFINPFMTAQNMAPIYPIYQRDQNGELVLDENGQKVYDLGNRSDFLQERRYAKNRNIVHDLQADDNTGNNYTMRGITYVEGKFLRDFTARVDYSLDYINGTSNAYQNMVSGDAQAMNGRIRKTNSVFTDLSFRQRIVWEPSFGPFASGMHSLAVTAGHENSVRGTKAISFSRTGFPDPSLREGAAAAINEGSNSYARELAMESYLAVASYDYDKKYFAKGSVRRDGTSRFSPQSRWGTFWSVGGGWMLSQEDFMSDFNDKLRLSELKLRISYGIQGNENLGSGLYYVWQPSYYFSPNAADPGYTFGMYGNDDLRWEGNYMFNPGIDFGFFNNRVTLGLDYYERGSNDLLYVRPFAPSVGISGMYDNVGATMNRGLEVTFAADVLRQKEFTWNVQLNLQHNRNKVTQMQRSDSDKLYGSGTIMEKGKAFGTFYMTKYAGVDSSNGDALYYYTDSLGEISTTNRYQIASLPSNRDYAGTPWRDLEGALINTFSYKGITLSFQLNFGIGGKFYDNLYANMMSTSNGSSGQNWHPDILDAWTFDNPNGSVPRVGTTETDINALSDRFLMSASFLKIQNINLNYQLPKKWTDAARFNSASVFVAADNVQLFTKRKGVDVQASFFGSNSFSYYPYRTVMFGLRLGL